MGQVLEIPSIMGNQYPKLTTIPKYAFRNGYCIQTILFKNGVKPLW